MSSQLTYLHVHPTMSSLIYRCIHTAQTCSVRNVRNPSTRHDILLLPSPTHGAMQALEKNWEWVLRPPPKTSAQHLFLHSNVFVHVSECNRVHIHAYMCVDL